MSVDLHSHSTASDGSYTPSQLARAFKAASVKIAALTDHDTVGGLNEFLSTCGEIGVAGIGGIEFSTVFRGIEVHLLGYGLLLENPKCSGFLERHRDYLIGRCRETIAKLAKFELYITIEQVLENSGGNPPMPPHILKALADGGYLNDLGSAIAIFHEYLAFGAKAWVDHETRFESPLEMLIETGAKAIVAHPFRFPNLSWLEDMLDLGAHGFELYYPDHNGEFFEKLKSIADKRGCLVTGGCDYHGAFAHRTMREVNIPLKVGIDFLKALKMDVPDELLSEVER